MSGDNEIVLKQDTRIRCKIYGVHYRLQNAQWTCKALATMNEPGLGFLQG